METPEEVRPERQKGDGLDNFRKWLTPILFVVCSYFLSKKLDEIDRKMEVITTIQTTQEVMKVQVNNLQDKYNDLKNDFEDHKRQESDKLYQKSEAILKRR